MRKLHLDRLATAAAVAGVTLAGAGFVPANAGEHQGKTQAGQTGEMHGQQGQTAGEAQGPQDESAEVLPGTSADDIRMAQAALKEKGYDVTVNGEFGTETRSALEAFQRKNGLDVSGQIDEATAKALSIPPHGSPEAREAAGLPTPYAEPDVGSNR